MSETIKSLVLLLKELRLTLDDLKNHMEWMWGQDDIKKQDIKNALSWLSGLRSTQDSNDEPVP